MCMYAVEAKCGHVGKSHYIAIVFPIIASDGKEAASIVRWTGRVKHDHKDAILSVKKIDITQYLELKLKNQNDGYLHCHNRQEQNLLDLKDRLIPETHTIKKAARKDRYTEMKPRYFKKMYIRKPKAFFKEDLYNYMDNYDEEETYIFDNYMDEDVLTY